MKKYFAAQFFLLVLFCVCSLAQEEAPKFNFNIGGGVTFPQSTIGNIANTSGNFQVGAGINRGKALGFDAEFMWNDLPPKSSVVALTGAPDGSAFMNSLTGNMILHSPEAHKFGFYGIGGIGWYHRSWKLTAPSLALGTTCLPSYAFWGVVCTNGIVSDTTTLTSGSNNGFGWNAGGGLTFRMGGSHLKLFTEARYHFAYFSNINTRVLPLTFGIRF